MNTITILFVVVIAFIIQLVILFSLIREATYSKENRKQIDVMTKLLFETAKVNGVPESILNTINRDNAIDTTYRMIASNNKDITSE